MRSPVAGLISLSSPARMPIPDRSVRCTRIFVAAAVLTPPDVVSQVMMAGPVVVLYFGSVAVSLVVTRKRGNQD